MGCRFRAELGGRGGGVVALALVGAQRRGRGGHCDGLGLEGEKVEVFRFKIGEERGTLR